MGLRIATQFQVLRDTIFPNISQKLEKHRHYLPLVYLLHLLLVKQLHCVSETLCATSDWVLVASKQQVIQLQEPTQARDSSSHSQHQLSQIWFMGSRL